MPRSGRLAAALLAVGSTLLAVPAAAPAAATFAPCEPQGFECATVPVPLDRSGAVPGTIRLNATRARAASNPRNVALVALAGGPGQAATPIAEEFARELGAGLRDRDLLVFDQRGTGGSGSLTCPALRQERSAVSAARRCAEQLGAPRGFFRTPDSVADLEALRQEAGYDKLALYGVSYGTKVALQYAAAHPDRVELLVLDSTVLPDGPDPLRVSALGAVPRVLRELCAGTECRGATDDVARDVRSLATRLRMRALRGRVVGGDGRRRSLALTQAGLFGVLLAGDLNPTLRAELPGAMRAALRGDAQPVLRLRARAAGLELGAGFQAAAAQSDAVYLATLCEEAPFRWTRTAGVDQRAREVEAVARSIPRAALGPFSSSVTLESGLAPLCLGWPNATPAPAPTGSLPDVPTLLLEGRGDLRTPLEDAAQVTRAIPGAQLVTVPFVGHSVLGTDLSDCTETVLGRFFAGQPAGTCPASENPFSPTPRPPASLDVVRAARGLRGKVGRTVSALQATIVDANRQVIGASLALDRRPSAVGGLRAGRALVSSAGIDLRGYQYVRNVSITGRLRQDGSGTFRVRGSAAARGSITITSAGRVSGTLGGRRISGSFASAAAAPARDGLPRLDRVLALPGIR
ncbi:alpha/beta fold hydrolase [Conexibacter sp. SYSU D00693]|uniref:alpha/beta fold hydrolase n=1 Tax=Conexibacter sp. SYSU D00693 TaxID=2812560 RepID=UPI00196A76E0|nr:alpha/beta fold hydrolase [Conexibacter sp. SYSU D00693]